MINLKKTLLYTLIPASFACGFYMQNVFATEGDESTTEDTISTYEVTIPAETTIDSSSRMGRLEIKGKVTIPLHALQIAVSSENDFKLTDGTDTIPYTITETTGDKTKTVTKDTVLKFPGTFEYEDPDTYGSFNKELTLTLNDSQEVRVGDYTDKLTFTFTDVKCVEFNVGAYDTDESRFVSNLLNYDLYIDGELYSNDNDLCLRYLPKGTTYEVKNISIRNKEEFDKTYIANYETETDSETETVYSGTVTGVTNVYLNVEQRMKTVRYYTNGGTFDDGTSSSWQSKTLEKGVSYGEFPAVSKDGDEFQGWYTSLTDGTKVETTDICNANITLYARWETIHYIKLVDGESFNQKIGANGFKVAKKIVFTQDHPVPQWYKDKNGHIENMDADNKGDVVAWLDNTTNPNVPTLYITTQSTTKKIAFNENSYSMFSGRHYIADGPLSVEEIDFGHDIISTSNVTSMNKMFHALHTIKKLDLSEFDTSNVTSMGDMFYNATQLNTIIVSDKFVVEQANCIGMFALTTSLPHYTAWWDYAGGEYAKSIADGGNFYISPRTVTFDANGGKLSDDVTSTTLLVENGRNYSTYFKFNKTYFGNNSFPTPTYEGKEFIGWYTASTGGIKVSENDVLNSDTDIVLYAQWSDLTLKLKTGKEINEKIPDTATSVVFTDEPVPESIAGDKIVDLSSGGDNSIVGWLDENNTFYISTQSTGQRMMFNADSSGMFKDKDKLTSINFGDFVYTNPVTSMKEMFAGCTNLTSLNLEKFDTSNVTDMSGMFSDDESLASIYATSSFSTAKVTESTDMFKGCKSLPNFDLTIVVDATKATAVANGGYIYMNSMVVTLNPNGGAFENDETKTVLVEKGCTYPARSLAEPTRDGYKFAGWYTAENDGTEITSSTTVDGNVTTLYAHWIEKNYVATAGTNIKLKIKNAKATAVVFTDEVVPEDAENIVDLSANGSESVVGWIKDGTYYISTQKEGQKVILNADSSSMFDTCTNIKSIDFSNIDTSQVTNMSSMFLSATGLTEIDLSNFNTSNVTNMTQMFLGCTGLTSLDLSSFDTSKVTNMRAMFMSATSLKEIIVSDKFDTSLVKEEGSKEQVFLYCKSLPNYDANKVDISLAKSTDDGGYLTVVKSTSNANNETLETSQESTPEANPSETSTENASDNSNTNAITEASNEEAKADDVDANDTTESKAEDGETEKVDESSTPEPLETPAE